MGMFGFDDRYVLYDVTPVENQFILNCLPTADTAQLRVYLYGLLQCRHPAGDMSVEKMAHDLNLTADEVMSAFRHWEFHHLVERVSDQPPVFRFISLAERAALGGDTPADEGYLNFAESLQNCFGEQRRLHGAENSMAFEWVEVMGLPAEVVLVMVRDLIRTHGLHFSFATTGQKAAARLADEQVRTVEDALALLSADEKVDKGAAALLRRMGYKRRSPSQDEKALYRKWLLEWGFDAEAIQEACAATVNAESPTFGYLDGVLRRLRDSAAQADTGERMKAHLQAEKDAAAPLKKVYDTLGSKERVINEGTLAVYREMQALYPDSIILLAAQECARAAGKLEDVQRMVLSWHDRGLRDESEVRAYVERFNGQTALLQRIYELTGAKGKINQTDRKRLTHWQEELGFQPEMILVCAEMAAGTEKPMVYLNSILESDYKLGITTPAQAMAERASWKKQPAAVQKLLPAQQYEQRDYTGADNAGMDDWLLKRWKEVYGDAK